ncbi:MAG: AMP-binding protein, partial [Enterovibrio sp.]
MAASRSALVLGNGAQAQTISWQQLARDVDLLAPFFAKLKSEMLSQRANAPRAQRLCSVVLPAQDDRYLLLITLLAAWQQGVATFLLNPSFSEARAQQITEHAGAVTLCDAQWQQLRALLHCKTSSALTFATINGAPPARSRAFCAKQVLTLTHTSGSSGAPKIVAHAMQQHLASAAGLLQRLAFGQDDCWLLSLPLFHISGLAILWRWLSVGATLKLADCSGANLLTALDGATHASLVPTQLQTLLDQKA